MRDAAVFDHIIISMQTGSDTLETVASCYFLSAFFDVRCLEKSRKIKCFTILRNHFHNTVSAMIHRLAQIPIKILHTITVISSFSISVAIVCHLSFQKFTKHFLCLCLCKESYPAFDQHGLIR